MTSISNLADPPLTPTMAGVDYRRMVQRNALCKCLSVNERRAFAEARRLNDESCIEFSKACHDGLAALGRHDYRGLSAAIDHEVIALQKHARAISRMAELLRTATGAGRARSNGQQ